MMRIPIWLREYSSPESGVADSNPKYFVGSEYKTLTLTRYTVLLIQFRVDQNFFLDPDLELFISDPDLGKNEKQINN